MSSAWRKWRASLALGLAVACGVAADAAMAQFYFRPFAYNFRYDLPPDDDDDFEAPRFASRRAVARILAREGFQLVGPLDRRGDQIVATGVSRRDGETRFFIDPFEGVIIRAVALGPPPSADRYEREDERFVPPLGGSRPVVKEIGRDRTPGDEARGNDRVRRLARPAPETNRPLRPEGRDVAPSAPQANAPAPSVQAPLPPPAPVAAPATRPARPAKPATPTQAAKPAEPSKPIEWAKPAEISKPAETAKPVEAAKAVEAPKPPSASRAAEAPKQIETPKRIEAPKQAEAPKQVEAPKRAETPKPVVAAKPAENPTMSVAARPAEPAKPIEVKAAPAKAESTKPEPAKTQAARVDAVAAPQPAPVTQAVKPAPGRTTAKVPAAKAVAARSTGSSSYRAIVPPKAAEGTTVVTPSTPATATAHSPAGAKTPQSVAMPKAE